MTEPTIHYTEVTLAPSSDPDDPVLMPAYLDALRRQGACVRMIRAGYGDDYLWHLLYWPRRWQARLTRPAHVPPIRVHARRMAARDSQKRFYGRFIGRCPGSRRDARISQEYQICH